MKNFKMTAPCLFGLEKLVSGELKDMGAESVTAENGRVNFEGDANILARANICSRYAERIGINMGTFTAVTFTQLFDNIKAIDWENYIGINDAFPVKGWSLDSALHSVPDCQSIIKKAIVERLKSKYGVSWFEETGPARQITFSIYKDRVSVLIDTSGEGLHKRGYRDKAGEAPLKETLAAAMAYLTRLYDDSILYDPFCGSGTILIESAMLVKNIAPGMRRTFAAEKFSFIPDSVWREERSRAISQIKKGITFRAVGTDTDPAMVELTKRNARLAGVDDCVSSHVADISAFAPKDDRLAVITNPPYGERLLDIKGAEELYKTMGRVFESRRGHRYSVISPHDEFEKLFGRQADKRRKLYNGSIRCQLYMYFR